MNSTKTLLIVLCLLLSEASYAIKPSSTYSFTPDALGLRYEEVCLQTEDGSSLNVWHLPSEGILHPVIISTSDAGNMGDWLYLGSYLQSVGMDVWLYDYRGFGSSSAFEIQQSYLFYTEFITDLSSVIVHVYESTGKTPVLLGLSMGTIIVEEYLKRSEVPICAAVFDGYVCNPFVWKDRLASMGRSIQIPDDYEDRIQLESRNIPRLYIVSRKDTLSRREDIPNRTGRHIMVTSFRCGHLEAFFKYPRRYIRRIQRFVRRIS